MARQKKKTGADTRNSPLTHFLCVPLITTTSKPRLKKSLETFRREVCQGPHQATATTPEDADDLVDSPHKGPGDAAEGAASIPVSSNLIAEKAIRPVGALHLTLGVMSLDANQLSKAQQLLQDLDVAALFGEASPSAAEPSTLLSSSGTSGRTSTNESSDEGSSGLSTFAKAISPPPVSSVLRFRPPPLDISLTSLASMHAPHKTSILYISPTDPTDRLWSISNAIRSRFLEAGLLVNDDRPLKLHATVVNTIYAKGRRRPRHSPAKAQEFKPSDGKNSIDKAGLDTQDDRSIGHGPDANAPLKIDARQILERYKDFVWAAGVELDRVAICEMGAKKVLNDKDEVINEEYKEVAILRLPVSIST